MATWTDARRIARSLPGAQVAREAFAFGVENKGKQKGFAWIWKERVEPKKPRVPNPGVIAVRVRNEAEKAALLAGDPERFFTEPHYNGFPAVLVRLKVVSVSQLRQLLVEAWSCQAPYDVVNDAGPGRAGPRQGMKRSRNRR